MLEDVAENRSAKLAKKAQQTESASQRLRLAHRSGTFENAGQ